MVQRTIRHVDETALGHDLAARMQYTKSFLNFTQEDGEALNSAKDVVAPAVPAILDNIYTHLISYDITAKSFVPPQPEQDSASAKPASLQELSLTHPNILHRKDFLKTYLVKLVSNTDWSDESRFWDYLDKVGIMHTGQPGFKHRAKRPELRVEVMHMSLLLGYVEDIVLQAVMGAEGLDVATKTKVIRAFNKVLWIQNDLFVRHYTAEKTDSQPNNSA